MVSALFQAIYYVLLAYGYDNYDLGVLYPIARGVAPLLSAIWAQLWLGDQMHADRVHDCTLPRRWKPSRAMTARRP